MIKPVMKQDVAVLTSVENSKMIVFYATNDAVTEFVDFGEVIKRPDGKNKYNLYVDPRFDFAEVLAYIQNYGKVTE